jgi:hypothetical protein
MTTSAPLEIVNEARPSPLVLCPSCGTAIDMSRCRRLVVCSCGAQFGFEQNILFLSPLECWSGSQRLPRDREAPQCLQLPKFPTQRDSVGRFIKALPAELSAFSALDLGCGWLPRAAAFS